MCASCVFSVASRRNAYYVADVFEMYLIDALLIMTTTSARV